MEGMDEGALRTLGGWSARSKMVERYTASVREQAALQRSRDFALTDRLLGDMATEPP